MRGKFSHTLGRPIWSGQSSCLGVGLKFALQLRQAFAQSSDDDDESNKITAILCGTLIPLCCFALIAVFAVTWAAMRIKKKRRAKRDPYRTTLQGRRSDPWRGDDVFGPQYPPPAYSPPPRSRPQRHHRPHRPHHSGGSSGSVVYTVDNGHSMGADRVPMATSQEYGVPSSGYGMGYPNSRNVSPNPSRAPSPSPYGSSPPPIIVSEGGYRSSSPAPVYVVSRPPSPIIVQASPSFEYHQQVLAPEMLPRVISAHQRSNAGSRRGSFYEPPPAYGVPLAIARPASPGVESLILC